MKATESSRQMRGAGEACSEYIFELRTEWKCNKSQNKFCQKPDKGQAKVK